MFYLTLLLYSYEFVSLFEQIAADFNVNPAANEFSLSSILKCTLSTNIWRFSRIFDK